MQTVIDVQHVSMKFNLMEEKVDTLKEYVVRLLKGKLLYNEFLALKDVSFTVQKGDIVGIVGFNGAGKSTMLKLLAGVLTPSEGKIRTVGTIAPLIEVGAGFDPELTARENIFLNGAILGYSRKFRRTPRIYQRSRQKLLERHVRPPRLFHCHRGGSGHSAGGRGSFSRRLPLPGEMPGAH